MANEPESRELTDQERMEIGATFDATRMFLAMHGHESDHDWLVTHMAELLDLGDRLIEAHDAANQPEADARCEGCDQPIPDDGDKHYAADVLLCVDCWNELGRAAVPADGGR